MTITVTAIEAGFSASLQDAGRNGGMAHGIPVSGALDFYSHRIANTLVGNQPGAATLEMLLHPPVLRFEASALVAVTGGVPGVRLDGRAVPAWANIFVRGGQTLTFERFTGRAGYLAVHGGWQAMKILGSRSAYYRGGFGGHAGTGAAIGMGDILTNAEDYFTPLHDLPIHAGRLVTPPGWLNKRPAQIKVVRGAFADNFSAEALALFVRQSYTVSSQSDRMGFRLQGEPLQFRRPDLNEIAACGTVFGTIQVPPDGQPIVLMADHQLTGGYPIIGVVTEADLPAFAQLLPGESLNFTFD